MVRKVRSACLAALLALFPAATASRADGVSALDSAFQGLPSLDFASLARLPDPIRVSGWFEEAERLSRAPSYRSARDEWSRRREMDRNRYRPAVEAGPTYEAPGFESHDPAASELAQALIPEIQFFDEPGSDPSVSVAAVIEAMSMTGDAADGSPEGPAVPAAAIAMGQYLSKVSTGAMQLIFNFRWLLAKGAMMDASLVRFGSRSELSARAETERRYASEMARLSTDVRPKEEDVATRTKKVVRSAFKVVLGILIGLAGWFVIRAF